MSLAAPMPFGKRLTLEEFWELPEPKDGSKQELIAGVLYMSPPPDFTHDDSSTNLNSALYYYLRSAGIKGKLYTPRAALWTGPATYVEPDLFYLSPETLKKVNPKHRDTADLVVEVLSPRTAMYDRNTKADTYAALNVRELWLVDPIRKTVEVFHLLPDAQRFDASTVFYSGEDIRSEIFPDLALSVDEICEYSS
jgi:Uma2 family endonuclease